MDPRVVAALQALERDAGRLLPEDVVAAARSPRSPLHRYFEWNDAVAAERYRQAQAARLIRLVRVSVIYQEIPISVPKYVRDPSADTGTEQPRGYRDLLVVRTDEDNARAVITEEMRRIGQAVRRAKTLAAALGLTEDIDRIDALAASIMGRACPPTPPGGTA